MILPSITYFVKNNVGIVFISLLKIRAHVEEIEKRRRRCRFDVDVMLLVVVARSLEEGAETTRDMPHAQAGSFLGTQVDDLAIIRKIILIGAQGHPRDKQAHQQEGAKSRRPRSIPSHEGVYCSSFGLHAQRCGRTAAYPVGRQIHKSALIVGDPAHRSLIC